MTGMNLRANFHTHTCLCDGADTPEDMVRAALEKGFDHLGFSGHVDLSPTMDIPAYQKEIRRLQQKYAGQIEILLGGEFDLIFPHPEISGFEYRIGSCHYVEPAGEPIPVDLSAEMLEKALKEYYGGDGYALCRDYYRREAMVAERLSCDVIGHFDLILKYNGELGFVEEEDPRYLGPAMETLEVLTGCGAAFEINTRQIRRGRMYPARRLLRQLREWKAELLISSDAHRAEELDHGFAEAAALAADCGFDHVNGLTVKEGKPVLYPIGLAKEGQR